MHTVLPNVFIPALLIGTIDFCHFIPLSLTLSLPGAHKGSMKQNLLGSFSPTLCIWSGWNLMWWWSSSSWLSWDYFWVRFFETREKLLLYRLHKNFNVGMHLDVYKSIWFNFGTMIDTLVLVILTCLFDLDFHWRLLEWMKAEISVPIVSQSFQLIWIEFSTLLRFVNLMNLKFISSRPFSIQGREPYLCDFVNKLEYWLVFRHLLTSSFKLGMMIGPLIPTLWYQFGWLWPSFKVTVVWGIKDFGCPFSCKLKFQFGWNSVCCLELLVLLKLMLNHFALVLFKGESPADVILWNRFNIIMCQETCELICFKLGMMLNTIEWWWYSLKVTGLLQS